MSPPTHPDTHLPVLPLPLSLTNPGGAFITHPPSAKTQQDSTPGKGYDRVIYFLIVVKFVQFCLGPIYDYLDGKLLGHSLRRNEKARIAMREEMRERGEWFPGWRVSRRAFYVFGTQLGLMILASWVVRPLVVLSDARGALTIVVVPYVHGRRLGQVSGEEGYMWSERVAHTQRIDFLGDKRAVMQYHSILGVCARARG